MLKRALLGATALVLLAGSASAADLSTRYPVKAAPIPVPMFSWTGFYIGGNVGWGWASNTYDYTAFGSPFTYSYDLGGSNGFFGGGQVGYNYQFANNVVLGAEADLEWADIGSSAVLVGGPAGGILASQNVDYFGTIRARLGYAMDRFLPYITGGAAWAKMNYSDPFGISYDTTKWGWTVGAGVEYAITNNWTVKAEYLYLNFDNTSNTLVNGDQLSVGTNLSTAKLGVNYKF
ncbi:porin family protein [Xanthobacter dioxanivorans]|uniref:Porin family protein n=1 Tax=Xanthobacter dioxanivorans TaxID=2528964 RepID=A0A974SIJ3_9HYPH|nr:outer membrane protein [Xanthobacter dioxanivorans]QRG07451.1 porin family protein [Xanthobacter dioxanivorans]